MKNKKSLLLLLAGIATTLAIILAGCSTEEPWNPNPDNTLVLSIVSGPSDTVAYGSNVSFSWTSRGGVGEVQYQYRLGAGSWSTLSNETSVYLPNRTVGAVFEIAANDAGNQTANVTQEFFVTLEGADVTAPTVWIESSPAEGSFIATGRGITFSWDGDDPNGVGGNLLFWWSFGGVDSDTSSTRSVSFENIAADSAEFIVTAWDQGYHPTTWWLDDVSYDTLVANPDSIDSEMNTSQASVTFIIRDATILYIDDYQWKTDAGDVDVAKERDQKQFYRDVLDGYAFAEWDNDVTGTPEIADLAGITTIIWAADSDNLGNADPNFRLWYDVGASGGGVLATFIDGGGKLILAGSEILGYLYNTNPPGAADFEAAYLGINDSTFIDEIDSTWWLDDVSYDTLIASPDSTIIDTSIFEVWSHAGDWFAWAIGTGESGFPDSMKIDVGKDGEQRGPAVSLRIVELDSLWWRGDQSYPESIPFPDSVSIRTSYFLKDGVTPLFTVGLDRDGDPAPNMGDVVAWTYSENDVVISATFGFDTYSMGLPNIRQTFQTILEQFGE